MTSGERTGASGKAVGPIVAECKRILEAHYGDRLAGLVLYGSVARNEDDEESDIDLLILLDGDFDYFEELRVIIDILFPTQLESDRLISAKPANVDAFHEGRLQLYRNAKREGIVV